MTEEIQRRLDSLVAKPGRHLLGITGPPGSGKSTLAAEIAAHFGPPLCVVVPMDGFHLANVQLARLGRADRKGAPDTFDADGYIALLRRLRHPEPGRTIYVPEFHREMEESIAAAIAVAPDTALVVTEGNYLLLDDPEWRPVRDLLDDIWYLDTDAAERRSRLIHRHQQFGRTQTEAAQWVEQTDEPNARLIESVRSLASFHVPADDRSAAKQSYTPHWPKTGTPNSGK